MINRPPVRLLYIFPRTTLDPKERVVDRFVASEAGAAISERALRGVGWAVAPTAAIPDPR